MNRQPGVLTGRRKALSRIPLSREILLGFLSYDETTGHLLWKERPLTCFSMEKIGKTWNKRFAGTVAGSVCFDEHGNRKTLQITILGFVYHAHRIIWLMLYGSIPDGMVIDHINGDPFDNRLSNLRLATIAQNCRNCRPRKNSGGLPGVTLDKQRGKYVTGVVVNGKKLNFSGFDTPEEAYKVYCEQTKKHYGEFAGRHYEFFEKQAEQ